MSDIMTRDERNILKSFERFSKIPGYQNPLSNGDATQQNPRFVVRPMRGKVDGHPVWDDLHAVAELSQKDKYIRQSSALTMTERLSLYIEWFKMFPAAFALLERIPADSNGVSIIGNTAILPLLPESMDRVATGDLRVVNLSERDLAHSATNRVLLFDTWVMHGDYKWGQCEDSLLPQTLHSCKHHGFGNVLTLKHLGILWDTGTPLQLYVEPSAKAMDRLMSRLGFASAAKSKETKKLLLFDYDPKAPSNRHNALNRHFTSDVLVSIEKYRSWWPAEWPT